MVRSYEQDSQCQELIARIILHPEYPDLYELSDGILRYKGKLYVGSSNGVRRQIMEALHSSSVGGHSGQRGSWHRISSIFYWPEMKQEVRRFVQACDSCQRNKAEHVQHPGLLQPLPMPRQAWTHISMDFIERLPISQNLDTILVVVDRFTKYSHFLPLAHPFSAKQVA